jgi:uracil-DNA glycosylase
MPARTEASSLDRIHARVVACRLCPELRSYCSEVSRIRKREFAGETYWGKPVPGLGDETARLLVVGLAPAAHGGNRTGRMFTGDSSGAWLARAMHGAGFATVPYSLRRGDGFMPIDAYITAALRCAPPDNRPTREQLAKCAGHMLAELAQLRRLRVAIGLGKIGFDAAIARLKEAGYDHGPRRPRFAHGAEFRLGPPVDREPLVLLASYHPSRQNTNTGRLTAAMLEAIFWRARQLLKYR